MYNLWSAEQNVIVKLYIKLGILIFLLFKIKQIALFLTAKVVHNHVKNVRKRLRKKIKMARDLANLTFDCISFRMLHNACGHVVQRGSVLLSKAGNSQPHLHFLLMRQGCFSISSWWTHILRVISGGGLCVDCSLRSATVLSDLLLCAPYMDEFKMCNCLVKVG